MLKSLIYSTIISVDNWHYSPKLNYSWNLNFVIITIICSFTASGSDVPFDQRSLDEQEEFFKRIADRLAQIGDQVVQEYHFESDTAVRGEEPGPSQGKISLLAEESRSRLSNGASSGAATGSGWYLLSWLQHG